MTELSKAIYLEVGFDKWLRSMRRSLLIAKPAADISHRAAFLGGVMFGQRWSGPASARIA